jgi:hypothetical protein
VISKETRMIVRKPIAFEDKFGGVCLRSRTGSNGGIADCYCVWFDK